jgi:hypothetical protein
MGFFSRGKKSPKSQSPLTTPGSEPTPSMFITKGELIPLHITNEICPLSLLPLSNLSSNLTRVFSCGHCFSTPAFVNHCSTLKITADPSSFRCPLCEANIKRVVSYTPPPPAPARGEDFYTFPAVIPFKYYGKAWEIINPESRYYKIKFPETMAEPSVGRACFKEGAADEGGATTPPAASPLKHVFKDGVENHVFDLLEIPRSKGRALVSQKPGGGTSSLIITILGTHKDLHAAMDRRASEAEGDRRRRASSIPSSRSSQSGTLDAAAAGARGVLAGYPKARAWVTFVAESVTVLFVIGVAFFSSLWRKKKED